MTKISDSDRELLNRVKDVDRLYNEVKICYEQAMQMYEKIQIEENDIQRIIKEKTLGFPWLADAISQYYELCDIKTIDYLTNKPHPAYSAAENIKAISKEKRELQKKFLIARNIVNYYNKLFPWIQEYIGENLDDLVLQIVSQASGDDDVDPVCHFLPSGEYEKLSTIDRNQKALDRYWKSRKTPWQIGRDYERYIGFLFEQKGYIVHYQGIEKGLEDLGRDLICVKGDHTEIVQCKYWREDKVIHEKHINQLFGTTIEYIIHKGNTDKCTAIDSLQQYLNSGKIVAKIITSATLSDTAKSFAAILGIKVFEKHPYKRYPSIKCNISKRDGSKIYHLPFDQQYDRTMIDQEHNECYVNTVEEAEKKGFRRAWRWHGDK